MGSHAGASKRVNREAGLQKEDRNSLAEGSRQEAVQSPKEKEMRCVILLYCNIINPPFFSYLKFLLLVKQERGEK